MKIFQTKLEFLSLDFSIPAPQELSFAFIRLLNFLDKILFNENEVPTFQKCILKKFTFIKKLKVLSSEKKVKTIHKPLHLFSLRVKIWQSVRLTNVSIKQF